MVSIEAQNRKTLFLGISKKYFCGNSQKIANCISALALILNALSQLALAPIVKFYLGIDGLGVWHLIFQTFIYLQLLDFGFSASILRQLASAKAKNDDRLISKINVTSRYLLKYIGLLFGLAALICSFIIPQYISFPSDLKKDFQFSLFLLACWGPLRYYLDLPKLSLRGFNRIVEFNWLTLLEGFGRPLMGIILLILIKKIYALMLGYIIIELFVRISAYKISSLNFNAIFDRSQLKAMMKFGGATSIIRISSIILFYTSSFIIGWSLGLKAVAIYQSSIALPYLVFRFGIIPFTNLLPELINKYIMYGCDALKSYALPYHLTLLFIGALTYSLISYFNAIFVDIWVGSELFAGKFFTMIYCLFCLLSIARHNGYMLYQAIGKLRLMLIGHIVEIPLNIILSLLLLKYYGLVGIAISFVIAHFIVFVISQIPFFKDK